MKQYVLAVHGARSPTETLPRRLPAKRLLRRAILLSVAAAVALGGLYTTVGSRLARVSAREEAAIPAHLPPTIAPPPARGVTSVRPASPPRVMTSPSRITRVDGRYVIELHAAAVGSTLAMLSEATRTTVIGGEVLLASPSRITATFVANSSLDAWKGVFGDVANFALTCGHSTCTVRFVSLASAPSNARPTSSPALGQPSSPSVLSATASTQEAGVDAMPDN